MNRQTGEKTSRRFCNEGRRETLPPVCRDAYALFHPEAYVLMKVSEKCIMEQKGKM